ncbi:hypothetical protein ACEPAH_9535 [Sanghuangporus vaninii]
MTLVSASRSTSLFIRQSSADGLGLDSIPDACQATCAPIVSTVNSCQELSCLCNNDVANQIADCGNCLVGVAGDAASSQQTKTQNIVDQFTNACNTSGEPVSSIQLSAVPPSSTAAGSGSTSASATTTSSASGTSDASQASSSSGSDISSAALKSIESSFAAGIVGFVGLTSTLLSI